LLTDVFETQAIGERTMDKTFWIAAGVLTAWLLVGVAAIS
jgi:hypothetical protein